MLHCNDIFVYIYVYTVHNSDTKYSCATLLLYTINLFVYDISLPNICVSSNVIGLNIFQKRTKLDSECRLVECRRHANAN